MANAILSGKNGKVVWNAEDGVSDVDVQFIQSWSVEYTADVADTTSMNDTWRTKLAGHKAWTATVECNAPAAAPDVPFISDDGGEGTQGLGDTWEDTAPAYLKIFLELWFGSSASDGLIYGPAIATRISYNTDMTDIIKVTYEFQGNGELLYCETEPTDFVEPLACAV